jgi:hypothetical protein
MKMNKLITLAAAALLTICGQAYAADTATNVDTSPISNVDDCTLLSSNVTVKLSTDVKGAYFCYTGGDTYTNNMLFFGTCHSFGSNADRTVTCTGVDAPVSGCTVDGTVTVTGRAAFLGSSDGGVISGLNLNNATCNNASILSRVSSYQTEKEAELAAAAQ